MFRALALKELREVGIIVLMVGAYWLLSSGTLADILPFSGLISRRSYGEDSPIPFVGDGFRENLMILSGLLAIGLGLRQTLGESIHGTYLFLLHRPATRRWLIGAKLWVGMGVYSVFGSILIMIHGIWAAIPGTHASPFFWSMTIPSWLTLLQMTFLYFGAFLAGLRPGRWYGTRLLPLAATVPLFTIIGEAIPWEPLWWIFAVVVGDLWLLLAIFHVARTREYP